MLLPHQSHFHMLHFSQSICCSAEPISNLPHQQDHQRWGYGTETHLEQPVYLAIWKDLIKEKRKQQGLKIN